MDSVRGIYQTTLQAASSIAGPVVDTVKSKFTGVTDVTQNYALPILTQKSYAVRNNSDVLPRTHALLYARIRLSS